MKLTKNFSLHEFACKDEHNTPVPIGYRNNVQLLANNLQVLRDEVGVPIHVNSGYRTPSYNKSVGGVKNSFHLTAMAADITIKNKTPRQVKLLIKKLIRTGKMKKGGIGLYAGFVHYDVRGYNAEW
jgi:uncharacterized protein YcbK (DUF882 family)